MAKESDLAHICKILSVDTRVRLLLLMKDRALCVGALSARMNVTQGAVSQHLRILRDAGLVVSEKRGYFVHYRVNKKTLNKFKSIIDRLLTTETD